MPETWDSEGLEASMQTVRFYRESSRFCGFIVSLMIAI